MDLEIHGINLARFFTAPELAWQVALKKTKLELDFLPNTNML